MKYKIIYDFILTLVKEEQVFNVFEKFIEKISDLNKLVSVTHNDKGSIPLLNEPHKVLVVK